MGERLPVNNGWTYVTPEMLGFSLVGPGTIPGWTTYQKNGSGYQISVDSQGFFTFYPNACFVAKNTDTGQLALVFRGTEIDGLFGSIPDLLTDVTIAVGSLFADLLLFSPLIDSVANYAAAQGLEFLAAGHSLGGALAEALASADNRIVGGLSIGGPGIAPITTVGSLSNSNFFQIANDRDVVGYTIFPNAHIGTEISFIDRTHSPLELGDAHSSVGYANSIAALAASEAFDAVQPGEFGHIYFANRDQAFTIHVPNNEFAFFGTGFNDQINGAARLDFLRIEGGAGDDTIYGGAGGNVLAGGTGVDTIYGGIGGDTLFGGDGADILYGISGSDALSGGAGDDQLFGGQGEDYLQGGTGNDLLTGGRGDDHYSIGLAEGADTINEVGDGNGTDTINLYVGTTFSAFDFNWFARDGNDLLIRANNAAAVRVVDIRIVGAGTAANAVETIDLYVGNSTVAAQSWSLTAIWQQLTGAAPSGGSSSNPGGVGGIPSGGTATAFTDDFNRADGTIGNGWTVLGNINDNPAQIINNRVSLAPSNLNYQSPTILHAADFSSNVRINVDLFGATDPTFGPNSYFTGIYFGGTGNPSDALGVYISTLGAGSNGASIQLWSGNGTTTNLYTGFALGAQIHVDLGYTPDGLIIGSIVSNGQRFEFDFQAPVARPAGDNIWIRTNVNPGSISPAIDNVSITNGALPAIDLNEQAYARTLTIGTAQIGDINAAWDKDWFAVDLVAGTAYRFQLRGLDSGGGTLADPFLRLRDASGASLIYNEDSGQDGRDALLFYVAPASGRYYLSVGGDLASGGTYTVSAETAGTTTGLITYGDQFANVLTGTSGADNLSGRGGNDVISGGAGNDQLWADRDGGPIGNDILLGGDGDDRLESSGGIDQLDGGSGNDYLYFARFGATPGIHYIADQAATATGLQFADGTTIRGIETVTLGLGDGDDIVDMHTGLRPNVEETIGLNGGNDILTVGGGAITATGGSGVDTLIADFRWASAAVFQFPTGFEPVLFGPTLDSNSSVVLRWSEFEKLVFHGGSAGDTIQQATTGDDELFGYGGGDYFAGGDGNDLLDGGDGADSLHGDAGADQLIGGDGDDLLYFDTFDTLIDGGAGYDRVTFAGSGTAAGIFSNIEAISLIANANLILTGTQFASGFANNTVLSGSGTIIVNMDPSVILFATAMTLQITSTVALTVNGTTGIDIIKGPLTAAMTVSGGDGADQIRTGNLADTIDGGAGNDKIMGLGGADILTGGAGSDQFRYLFATDSGLGSAADQILDFINGSDKLDFRVLDADPNTAGRQALTFIGSAAFATDGSAQVRYVDAGADTRVEVDLNGDGAADMQILLVGHAGQTLSGTDFLL